ncbi:OsmC family protein [Planctomycetota bacterium]
MDLITVSRRDGRSFDIKVRSHTITTDLTQKENGNDDGPTPVDLFVGTLGACIGTMVQGYCDKHGYEEGDVSLALTYELADHPKRISAITVDLEIPEDVPDERKKALRRVAELCPVHATLRTPPRIDLDIV